MKSELEYLRLASRASRELTVVEPQKAFREMGRPALSDLTMSFHGYTRKKLKDSDIDTKELQYLLTNGFQATQEIVTNTIKQSKDIIKKPRAMGIATNMSTVETLSVVAMQGPDVARQLIDSATRTDSPYVISPDGAIRFENPDYQSIHPYRGCVGAYNRETGHILPVFRDFVQWSATVSIHSMYKRRRAN